MSETIKIKIMLSEKLSCIQDKSLENAIREIIFNDNNKINWQDVKESLLKNMPELKEWK